MASDRSAPDMSWQQLTDMTPAALRDTLPMVRLTCGLSVSTDRAVRCPLDEFTGDGASR